MTAATITAVVIITTTVLRAGSDALTPVRGVHSYSVNCVAVHARTLEGHSERVFSHRDYLEGQQH